MDDRFTQLDANPGDWHLRCSVAHDLYESGQYEKAAGLMTAAPLVPGGDENIVFAATVIAAANPQKAAAVIERYTAVHGMGFAILQLRKKLGLDTGPSAPVAAGSAPLPVPADPAPVSTPAARSVPEPVPAEPVLPGTEEVIPVREEEEPAVPNSADPPTATRPEYESKLILVGAEAIQAAEVPPLKKEQLRAVMVAVGIHVILLIALTFWSFSTPPPPPPQITASASPDNSEDDIENRTLKATKTRTASEVTEVQPVVNADAFSNLALPDTFDLGAEFSMTSFTEGELSLGMSMGGLGGVSNMGSIPAGMRSRCTLAQRMERLRESGGEDRAERAVVKGLEFLARKQNRETGAFGDVFTAGMSGLALLAFLGHCETPESMKFGDAVSGAAIYLMNRCRNNAGKITNGKNGDHETYEHAMATYALAELFTMTNESGKEIPQLEAVLRRAVDVIIKAQSDDGGWPYGFDREQTSDMSVTSWHVQALKAAYNTGRTFPGIQASLDKATTGYIPSIQDSVGAFKYQATDRDGRPSLTGAALLSMEIWKGSGTLPYKKGLEYLIKRYDDPIPRMDSIFYATYYNTQLLFLVGGEPWENYNRKLQPWLLDSQNEDGSWTTDGGVEDRQFYNTAWAILMLEVYYRYLPTTDKKR